MPEFESEFFSLSELTASDYAARHCIDNTPGAAEVSNLQYLARHILDPIRLHAGAPVIITSGYRCRALNRAIGGSGRSQHMEGLAADIRAVGYTAVELYEFIFGAWETIIWLERMDQCILEFGSWVHISASRDAPRHQFLVATKLAGKTAYESPVFESARSVYDNPIFVDSGTV